MVRPVSDSFGANFPKDPAPTPQQQIADALKRIHSDMYVIKDYIAGFLPPKGEWPCIALRWNWDSRRD